MGFFILFTPLREQTVPMYGTVTGFGAKSRLTFAELSEMLTDFLQSHMLQDESQHLRT